MASSFDHAQKLLRQLPGLGFRSAERIALHLLVEQPEKLDPLLNALRDAAARLRRCSQCGNMTEVAASFAADAPVLCEICRDSSRRAEQLCIVETVVDLLAMERAGAYRGLYHVLHGKLSPLRQVGPEALNLASLAPRLDSGAVTEVVLALSNDIEGEATCHYLQSTSLAGRKLAVSRIGFGLPSGSGLTYADADTLRSALAARREYQ
ncbi:MAG TPA: recombination mediator RecR [Opitutales bacterium]|jgi:recombination protein RecR|nr:recombination mediator RecR [Opitutales bacterium]